jgi:hypothetical protein
MTCCGFIAVFVVLIGCRTGRESKIIGLYRAEAGCLEIRLAINPDHSFTQSVRTNEGEAKQLAGTWSLDRRTNYVTFRPFLDFLNGSPGVETGSASFQPELMGWVVEMGPVVIKCPDSSREINYTK